MAVENAALTVAAVSHNCIYVTLKNGQCGYFDVAQFWHKGILKELQNPHYFRRVMLEDGIVCWPNGQDIAPETLVENLQNALAESSLRAD